MELLNKEHFSKLTDLVKEVPFNNLFARAVIDNMISGKVFVDNSSEIKTAYIVHPYGMTLLVGDSNNEAFNQQFRNYALNADHQRNNFEWMQTYPRSWDDQLKNLFGDQLVQSASNISKIETGIVELNTRVNFKFDRSAYHARKTDTKDPNLKIVPTDSDMYKKMRGTVVPKYFWNNENDFFTHGMSIAYYTRDNLRPCPFPPTNLASNLNLVLKPTLNSEEKGLQKLFVLHSLIIA